MRSEEFEEPAGEEGPVAEEESAAEGEPSGEASGPVQEELIPGTVDPGALEAILLVVDEPITAVTLAAVLDRPEHVVVEALRGLSMAYDVEQRGFDLREVAGGWRLYTRERYADLVEKFVVDGQQARLTQAALETLAVVAYRQPVSRGRVSAIRGVNCDGVMRTLVSRGLVEEAGTDHETGATLYRTTSYFLERLGLNSLDELPDLAPYLPDMDEMDEPVAPGRVLPGDRGENPGEDDPGENPGGDEPGGEHSGDEESGGDEPAAEPSPTGELPEDLRLPGAFAAWDEETSETPAPAAPSPETPPSDEDEPEGRPDDEGGTDRSGAKDPS